MDQYGQNVRINGLRNSTDIDIGYLNSGEDLEVQISGTDFFSKRLTQNIPSDVCICDPIQKYVLHDDMGEINTIIVICIINAIVFVVNVNIIAVFIVVDVVISVVSTIAIVVRNITVVVFVVVVVVVFVVVIFVAAL